MGAATSLALALLIGGRVFATMKRSLGAGEWVRRGLGVAVLAGVAAIALGLDTGLLTRVSLASTASLEQNLLDRFHPAAGTAPASSAALSSDAAMAGTGPAMSGSNAAMTGSGNVAQEDSGPAMAGGAPAMMMKAKPAAAVAENLPVEGSLPSLAGATDWLNSPPLTAESLKGKVVLVDFWTYSCINCLRAIPYVRAWAEKYKDQGLVVIGVHAPEFAFEKRVDNVKKAVSDLGITYPVAIDNDYGSGVRSTTTTGQRTTSSTRRVTSVTTTSARATTTARNTLSNNCWPKPARRTSRRTS